MNDVGKRNWPPIFPIIYHDINVDIDEAYEKSLAKRSFNLWKMYCVTLMINLVAVIALATTRIWNSMISSIILAALYLLILPVVDFAGRHWNLYRGLRTQSSLLLRVFLVAQVIFLIFDLLLGIGWFAGGGGGIIAATECFRRKKVGAGILSLICVSSAFAQLVLNGILLIKVYKLFESKGYTLLPGGKK
ncbi:hypothetical protein G9A89_009870 [Geosiphon pyriformis]|nr:hypothetical protein G9A89_009870 [Geosiphon pyriformis]